MASDETETPDGHSEHHLQSIDILLKLTEAEVNLQKRLFAIVDETSLSAKDKIEIKERILKDEMLAILRFFYLMRHLSGENSKEKFENFIDGHNKKLKQLKSDAIEQGEKVTKEQERRNFRSARKATAATIFSYDSNRPHFRITDIADLLSAEVKRTTVTKYIEDLRIIGLIKRRVIEPDYEGQYEVYYSDGASESIFQAYLEEIGQSLTPPPSQSVSTTKDLGS